MMQQIMGFRDTVASAGPANNLHLAPDTTTPTIFTGRVLFLRLNQQCQSTEGIIITIKSQKIRPPCHAACF